MRLYYSLNFEGGKSKSEELLINALNMEGVHAKISDIYRKESGKPYFEKHDLHFSISHSGNVWMCAFSDSKIGIDFQFFKKLDADKLAQRFFSSQENAFLQYAGEKRQQNIFFEIWARKEAAGKFFETGIFKNGIKSINTVRKDLNGYVFIDEIELSGTDGEQKKLTAHFVKPQEMEKINAFLCKIIGNGEFAFCACAETNQVVEDIIKIGI